jgi:hypothetical protein
MGSAATIALAAAWLAAAPGARAPAAGAFCSDLGRLLEAAREKPAFASLPAAEPVAALGFAECGLGLIGESLVCIEDFPDSLARFEALRAGVAGCRPDARAWSDPRRSPLRADEHEIQLLVGRVLITLHEAGYANRPERYVAMHVERAPKRAR